MDKLNRTELKNRDDLIERLTASQEALGLEHQQLVSAIETFNEKVDLHNQLVAEAREWRDDVVNQIGEFIADKSDKWQEGERGQSVEAWKGEIENLDLEDVDPVEIHDLPDLLHAETLEQMQTEAFT